MGDFENSLRNLEGNLSGSLNNLAGNLSGTATNLQKGINFVDGEVKNVNKEVKNVDMRVSLIGDKLNQTNNNINTILPDFYVLSNDQQYVYPELDEYLSTNVPGSGWLKTYPATFPLYPDSVIKNVLTIKAGTFFSLSPPTVSEYDIVDKFGETHKIESFKAIRYDIHLSEPIDLVGPEENGFATNLGLAFLPRTSQVEFLLNGHKTVKNSEKCPFHAYIFSLFYNLINLGDNGIPEMLPLIPGGQFATNFIASPFMLDFQRDMHGLYGFETAAGFTTIPSSDDPLIGGRLPYYYTMLHQVPDTDVAPKPNAGYPAEFLIARNLGLLPGFPSPNPSKPDPANYNATPQDVVNLINAVFKNADAINAAAGNMEGSVCPVHLWLIVLLFSHGGASLLLNGDVQYVKNAQGNVTHTEWVTSPPTGIIVTQDLKDRLDTSTTTMYDYSSWKVGDEVDMLVMWSTWFWDSSTPSLPGYWWVDTSATNPGSLAYFVPLLGSKMVFFINNLLNEGLPQLPPP
jgi:hypothetical protein